MISAELRNNNYLIRFKGKKHEFNEYINTIMSIPDKSWNMEEKCWSIPISSLPEIKLKFDNKILFLDEVKEFSNKDIIDYENMGSKMKLTPYDYQKEAIKFGIDNHNMLIVYPCGSGRECI